MATALEWIEIYEAGWPLSPVRNPRFIEAIGSIYTEMGLSLPAFVAVPSLDVGVVAAALAATGAWLTAQPQGLPYEGDYPPYDVNQAIRESLLVPKPPLWQFQPHMPVEYADQRPPDIRDEVQQAFDELGVVRAFDRNYTRIANAQSGPPRPERIGPAAWHAARIALGGDAFVLDSQDRRIQLLFHAFGSRGIGPYTARAKHAWAVDFFVKKLGWDASALLLAVVQAYREGGFFWLHPRFCMAVGDGPSEGAKASVAP